MADDEAVLVTGGAGFIGSNLVDRLLAEGRRVIVVDDLSTGRLANLADARRAPTGHFEFQRLDLTRGALERVVERHRPAVICHLAAQINVRASVDDPLRDASVNVLGTVAVLEAARKYGTRKVVFATSGGTIYGEPPEDQLPTAETAELGAHSPYGAAKICGEHYLRAYRSLYGLEWTSLALANVYGPRQDPAGEAGVVAIFIEQMLAGAPVTVFGDGEQTRDFVYVDDVVHAFVRAMDRGDGQRFNIGTGERTSVNQLFSALAAALQYDAPPERAPERVGELRHSALDCRLAATDLEWKPWTTLPEGLAATLAWSTSRSA